MLCPTRPVSGTGTIFLFRQLYQLPTFHLALRYQTSRLEALNVFFLLSEVASARLLPTSHHT